VILVVAALAIGPASFVLLGGGGDRERAPVRAAARTVPATSIATGCVERPRDDAPLSPFAAHPPLPRTGFYAPGRGPDQDALVHALSHGYVIVRYRPELAHAIERRLRTAVRRASQPVVVVAGTGMPFAAGAVVYGRTSVCGTWDGATGEQLADWVRRARPTWR
jgi:hypothetical protein